MRSASEWGGALSAAVLTLALLLPRPASGQDGGLEVPESDAGADGLVGQQGVSADAGVDADAGSEAAAESLAGEPIVSVEVFGNRRVLRERISAVLTQTVGEPYDPAKVAQDLRSVFALGDFSDAEISVQPVEGGVRYLVRVEERPVVREVRIYGATKVTEAELREASGLRRGQPAGPVEVGRAARALERLYSERGFAQTTVEGSTQAAGEGSIDVVLRVEEKPRVRISEVRIEGASAERAAELLGAIPLKEASLLTRITGSSTYTPQRLRQAVEVIESWYFDRGFLDARVEPQVELTDDGKRATVSFRIFEGGQYTLASVGFEGGQPLSEERLRGLAGSRAGALIDRSQVGADVAAITEQLHERGFACAAVVPSISRREGRREVDLVFRVNPGESARVRRILVTGNTKTRARVVVRELALEEGEPYSASAVRLSHERLQGLGLFERAEIRTASGCEGGEVDVGVEVVEAKTLGYQLSFGLSSDEFVVGTLLLVERNLLGTGRALSAQGQYSQLRAVASGAFLEPHLLGSDLDLTLDLAWNRFEYPDFVRTSTGGSANLRYPFGRLRTQLEGLTGLFGYSFQDVGVDLEPTGLTPEQAAFFRSGRISALGLSLAWAAPEPARSIPRARRALVGVEVSPRALGAEIRYARYTANIRWGFELPAGLLLRTRAGLGVVDPVGPDPVPASERYFLGGIDSLRGYRYRSISPQILIPVPLAEPPRDEPVAIGGTEQLLLGLELEAPVSRRARLDVVLFVDAGNVFLAGEPAEPWRDLPVGLFWSTGFGVRWYSPAGVVRLELAFPLIHRLGDPPVVLEIGAGQLP